MKTGSGASKQAVAYKIPHMPATPREGLLYPKLPLDGKLARILTEPKKKIGSCRYERAAHRIASAVN